MTLQNLLGIVRLKEQTLPLTLNTPNEVWVVLDALRRQRNANDYTGQPVTQAAMTECLAQAKGLRFALQTRLAVAHPDLLSTGAQS